MKQERKCFGITGELILKLSKDNQFIRQIELNREKADSFYKYPFSLPAIRELSTLKFHPKVTFIIGENGGCSLNEQSRGGIFFLRYL